MKARYTFRKEERLCSLKTISLLFEKGNVFHSHLFRVIWLESPAVIPYPAQVLFTISKRNMRLAVQRNLARRKMREAYRINKQILYESLGKAGKQIVLALVLKSRDVPEYGMIEKSVRSVLVRLSNSVSAVPGEQPKC